MELHEDPASSGEVHSIHGNEMALYGKHRHPSSAVLSADADDGHGVVRI